MIGIALLGCGRIGAMHAQNLSRVPGGRLASVFDPVGAAARQVADRLGCPVASSVDEAIAGADAVLIATSTSTHADLIEVAAKAGKAIFCEKPIDLGIARVEACRAAIKDSGVPVQLGFNRRFDPGHRAARDAVAKGDIGTLEQVIITSRDPGPPPRSYLEVSGGLFRDMTIHDFDLARFVMGEDPVSVYATGSVLVDPSLSEIGDIDSAMVVMRTASGRLCHINNSRRATFGYDQRVELFGSAGMVISDNRTAHGLERFGGTATRGAEPFLNFFIERYREAFEAELLSFVTAVSNGTAPEVGFDDGYKALLLAEAAIQSMKSGRAVEVQSLQS